LIKIWFTAMSETKTMKTKQRTTALKQSCAVFDERASADRHRLAESIPVQIGIANDAAPPVDGSMWSKEARQR
jgi:hypothetical protein